MGRLGCRPERRFSERRIQKQHQGYVGQTARLGTLPLDQLGHQSSILYARVALGHMTTQEQGNEVSSSSLSQFPVYSM